MIVRLGTLALAAALFSVHFVACDTSFNQPVQSLIESANALLAKGDMHGALDHFEAAIKKDPTNYLTIFKRGATYLSLGRSNQASADFDAVLSLKPDFEAALLQRAKLKSRTGDWNAARRDYKKAGGVTGKERIAELEEAERAVKTAMEAEKKGDYEACVTHAGTAIMVASGLHSLRSLRARCRLKRGEVHEAVGDLTHLVQLLPGNIDPHLQIANLLYFSVNDYDRAVAQLRKCLHSDPDSKPCSKRFRRIKDLEKSVAKVRTLVEKRQYTSATRLLVGHSGETGLIDEVKEEVADIRKAGYYTSACPEDLLLWLLETTCEVYTETKNNKKATPHCAAALSLNPNSLPALLSKATTQLAEDLFEEAIRTLEHAKQTHPDSQPLLQKLQEAHTLLRRSKAKDYYKVLSVPRDASDREIKRAYRALTKKYHPDKYRGELSQEEILKNMAAINEAYEVLSNEELRARFDAGDDPNEQDGPGRAWGHGGQNFMFRGGPGGGGGQQFMFRGDGGQGDPFGGFKFQF
ncbi:unnamed protein product [Tuber melanosporum]|uniref:Tetratricopeptide repeat and J domain-containing co-chaperone DNJ1 n=1 Tax=Tuber melanosporum (strain Mel28) TaxID=656061 RepID=D5GGR2_TUBMM|nr:uncharacterized protein GSTUM_00007480001 [Tuber melanosporum]CAZ83684.1 unnamed protein product [Tuber melanosporum]